MSDEQTNSSTAASDEPAPTHSRRWSLVTIVSVVIGLALAGIMTAAMFWIGDYYQGSRVDGDEEGRRKLQELQAAEKNDLETYGWINRTDGVVRIPIDRAMQLLVEERPRKAPALPTSGDNPPPSRK